MTNPIEEEALLGVLRSEPSRRFPLRELLKAAAIPSRQEKEVKRMLKALVRRGMVERDGNRRFRLSRAGQQVEGFIEMDARGLLSFVPEGEKPGARGIPVLPEDQERVTHHDRVIAELVVRGRRGHHFAEIIEVLERKQARHVGVFRQISRAFFVEIETPPSFLTRPLPGRRRAIHEVVIPKSHAAKAKDGDLVEVEISEPARDGKTAPLGKVLRVFGPAGERTAEMGRLLAEHDLDHPFPEDVEAEAAKFGEPSKADLNGRRDLRHLPLVTIDGETAKDFDDAVSAEKDGDGYRVYVAIADVSHYVRMGSALDREAYRRGTSVYLTDRAIPMLPEALSTGLCSLNPGVDRLCMLVELALDGSGRVKEASYARAVMRSRARLTYTRVAKALEGEPDEECAAVLPQLLLLWRVAGKLLERRLRRGTIDLDLPEAVIVFDGGEPSNAVRRPRNDATRLIEELMIAANEAVAAHFQDRELPTVFRVHEPPDPERIEAFIGLCEQLGLRARLSKNPEPAEVAHLLEVVSEHERGKALHGLLLRSLSQARYHPECLGHYGLASDRYLHFTSPIRRYPDLIVHRLLKQSLDAQGPRYSFQDLLEISRETSSAERRAMAADRASLELDRALIARRLVGTKSEGTIKGVQPFGLFVALDEPFVEGLVPVQALPMDRYSMDVFGATLTGQVSGRHYELGGRIEVEIASVNVSKRQIELSVPGIARAKPSGIEMRRRGGRARDLTR